METLYDLMNALFDGLYYNGVEPLLLGISYLLRLLFSPLGFLQPVYQIISIAMVGAILSILLARRFRSKKEKILRSAFKKKLATMSTTASISNKRIAKMVRKEINDQADKIYEKMLLDKFTEMGITYFFPMFSFLIWIEYNLFTPEHLKSLTGFTYAWISDSGIQVSAAYLYLWFFTGFLIFYYLLLAGLRFVVKRGIFKVKIGTNKPVVK